MADASTYLRNAIVDEFLRAPATVFLALFVDATTELAVTGYARKAVTFDAPVNGFTDNTGALVFGPLSDGGEVTHAALFDAVSGGNQLTVVKELDEPVPFLDTSILTVPIANIDVQVE